MASPNPTLEPGALLKADGNYELQSADLQNLIKFLWTGALLPGDDASYKSRLNLTDFKPVLKPLITTLLSSYRQVKSHCTIFKDHTYKDIVELSSAVYSYAQDAGGTIQDSYYANILKAGKDLYTETAKPIASQNQATIDQSKALVAEIIAVQLEGINAIREKAQAIKAKLQEFETQCKADQIDLQSSKRALTTKLEGAEGKGGTIATLEAKLTAKRKELKDSEYEYEQDVIKAATVVTYAWCYPIGTICAIAVAAVYGDKAAKMKATVEAIKTLIADTNTELAADKALAADMHLVDNDLGGVLATIGPAITTIEKMIGVWNAIADDLGSIQNMVKNQSAKGGLTFQTIAQDKIVSKWNALATAVDKYRKWAFVSTPSTISLTQLATNLGKVPKAA